ncbi:MAG: hypothetical protein CMH55_00965 [Myxococcales bacterium]|nr:hypothetical protein [Myxococcales bacterium]
MSLRICPPLLLLCLVACAPEARYSANALEPIDTSDSQPPLVEIEEEEETPPSPPSQDLSGDRCFHLEPQNFPSCCNGGEARCIDQGQVPDHLRRFGTDCGQDGLCIPSKILQAVDHVPLVECTSIGHRAGACRSTCGPLARFYGGQLPQDRCDDGDRCVPCVDPDTGEPTGACESVQCLPQSGHDIPEQEPESGLGGEFSCENPPDEPVIDVNILPECGVQARCVPTLLVEEDLRDDLSSCENDEGRCVPEELVEAQGFWTPPSCEFPGGLEGRCLSTVFPAVGERAHELSRGSCQEHERCSPCCDPTTGELTDACNVGCDEGPAEGTQCEPIFTSCCEDRGQCLARELIPAGDRRSLERDQCDRGMLCVPHLVREEDPRPATCRGEMLLLGQAYTGVCLPDCLKVPLEVLMVSQDCGRQEKCVPCRGPLGRPTGAPGCPD